MPALTLEELLMSLQHNVSPEDVEAVDISGRAISSLPQQLRFLRSVRTWNAARNDLADLTFVAKLPTITSLNISFNRVGSLRPLEGLHSLVVLNASHNGLSSLGGLEGCAGALQALILNDNDISLDPESIETTSSNNVCTLSQLKRVSTVILSRNPLCPQRSEVSEKCGENTLQKHPLDVFQDLPQLKKLSLSDCGISALPQKWFLPLVVECRLSMNNIASFPSGVILRSVKLLDVSRNKLTNCGELRRCRFVTQLNVHGNPFAETWFVDDAARAGRRGLSDEARGILCRMFKELKFVDGIELTRLAPEPTIERHPKRPREDVPQKGKPPCNRDNTHTFTPGRVASLETHETDMVAETFPAPPVAQRPVVRRERHGVCSTERVNIAKGATVKTILAARREPQRW